MCRHSEKAAGFSMAARGSTPVTRPLTLLNPTGVFIHAFAMVTKIPEATPETATTMPANKCTPGETRFQP